MACWFWNIDRDELKYFKTELQHHNKLRQGWGWWEGANLNLLQEKRNNDLKLTDDEENVWKHCGPMLDRIEIGDFIVVRNVPEQGYFTLVEVVGEYHFDYGDNKNDYGHYLPIKVLGEFSIDKLPAKFIAGYNAARHAIGITYEHSEAIEDLAKKLIS